ncbi:transcriptional regulator, AraC family [Thermotoga petrophila RKU-1]|uniref:Transcriptional regulator, AraC family n=1 Tax=Thermotoga petrophila (strain ATCC BAA-488 / DSM 13995 / JCM 10881 / RKU-1) TaxID=390874 RepID=A5INH3_THEP1|nr:AraC family transcriptional regulator [Thermotoga petrophila]ABQ47746.1 transcriptional regulator, AraC family [Thermotoga petrophila RKU-1]
MDEFDHTRRKLIERILHLTEKQPVVRPLPGLTVGRRESPTEPSTYILPPSICIAVQGAKRVLIGEEYYVYDVENFLLNSFDIPVIAQVIEASKEKPYIGITWEIDMEILMEIVVEQKLNTRPIASSRGTSLGKVTYQLLDAFKRMLDLLDEPEHISALLPVIKKEIIYRLLVSEQGSKLIQIALSGKNDVIAALNYLKEHFSEPVNMKKLAEMVGMSVSTFYQNFKTLTGMTPLQYQKKLRLCEARKLLMAGHDVTTAAYQVGYESLSQFSREYKRFFGVSPSQDAKRLRNSNLMDVVH